VMAAQYAELYEHVISGAVGQQPDPGGSQEKALARRAGPQDDGKRETWTSAGSG
jgi:hypothetical protein